MQKILVISGPNLNSLGSRNSSIYEQGTLEDIHHSLEASAKGQGVEVVCKQLNHEHDFINAMHDATINYAGIIINAHSLDDYSDALGKAIAACDLPCIAVDTVNNHLSAMPNSAPAIAAACWGVIGGLGQQSYLLALDALVHNTQDKR